MSIAKATKTRRKGRRAELNLTKPFQFSAIVNSTQNQILVASCSRVQSVFTCPKENESRHSSKQSLNRLVNQSEFVQQTDKPIRIRFKCSFRPAREKKAGKPVRSKQELKKKKNLKAFKCRLISFCFNALQLPNFLLTLNGFKRIPCLYSFRVF